MTGNSKIFVYINPLKYKYVSINSIFSCKFCIIVYGWYNLSKRKIKWFVSCHFVKHCFGKCIIHAEKHKLCLLIKTQIWNNVMKVTRGCQSESSIETTRQWQTKGDTCLTVNSTVSWQQQQSYVEPVLGFLYFYFLYRQAGLDLIKHQLSILNLLACTRVGGGGGGR